MSTIDPFEVLEDDQVARVLRRLHSEADKQMPGLIMHYLPKLPGLLMGREISFSKQDISGYYADKYIALDPDQAAFCHLVARTLNARTVVEFGSSFGISTIWLASALKANGGGVVIGSEIVESKAEKALQNIEDAGLSSHVEIRVGDARETLKDLPSEVDLFLNDGFPMLALELLKAVKSKLRIGSVVITDNIGTFKPNFRSYLSYIRDHKNGFRSSTLPFKSGTEYSIKVK